MRKDDKNKDSKYVVTILFNKEQEVNIRNRAKELELPVATYIKQLVRKDCKEVNKNGRE